MCHRHHAVFHKFDPDKMLEVVRGGHTEHFLPRPTECTGELWHYEHADDDLSVCLDSGRYEFEAVVRGTFRPGYVCLGRVETATPSLDRSTEINGATIGRDNAQIYPEGVDFFYHAQPGTRWTAVQIRREDLQRTAASLLGHELDLSPRRITNLSLGPRGRSLLLALSEAALRPPAEHPGPTGDDDGPALARAIVEGVVEALALAQRDGAFDEHQIRVHNRLELVRRAQDMLRLTIAVPYDSRTLCMALRVPERTLQLAFQRTLAMSPSRWLHTARLHEARRQLRQADPLRETVAGIASRCGLGHAGRFSCDYAKLFGESPSVTLRVG